MNKRQPGEAVLRGGPASEEVAARAINAEPWDPLPVQRTRGVAPRVGVDFGSRAARVNLAFW
jgi:hypothetical protein